MRSFCFLFTALIIYSGAAAGAEFDAVTATDEYLATVSAAEQANTNAYVNATYLIMVLGILAECVVALLLLQSGWSRRWRDWAEHRLQSRFGQAFIYVPVYSLVTIALMFPLSWFSGFYTEHEYGLSNQDFSGWLVEFLQADLFVIIGLTLFVACLYLVIRRTRQNWWMWGVGLTVGFTIILSFIAPLYVQPVFNDYRPMDEGELKQRILSMARANGMDADDVKQVDESKQTKRVSAFVTGVFGTTRIALNDNLLMRASPDAVEAVMGHEIGHYVLNHSWKSLAWFTLIFLLCFALTNTIFNAIVRRKGKAWGIRGIDDYAGFPLLYAIASVLIFLATPVFYKITYIHEAEADIFAINAVDNPEAWAEVALLTAEYRKLRPPQWEENWLNHHPSPYARVYMAMRWKAEQSPEQPAMAPE